MTLSSVSDGARRSKALRELADAVPGARVVGDPYVRVRDIGFDSRAVSPGSLFVALRGGDFDGHDHVAGAVKNGATALLVEDEVASDIPQIIAPASSRAALSALAAEFYDHPSLELSVIGITGTDGKTTTSAMLETILSAAGNTVGVIGTIGVRIGDGRSYDMGHQTTPESVYMQKYLREMVDAGTGYAVVEATSHGLATHRLDDVRFVAGGITNITHEHLELHGTVDNYRRAKARLLEAVGKVAGVVVLNNSDPGAMSVQSYAAGATVLRYSASDDDVELKALDIRAGASGTIFDAVVGDNTCEVLLPMPGKFNVANALCAIGLAGACGVGLSDAAKSLTSASPVSGRMQPIDAGQDFTVIVDYAHTPESLTTVLTMLRQQTPDNRLIVVTGSAGERDTAKRPLQGAACARIADITIVTSEDPRREDPATIIEEIIVGAEASGAVRGESVLGITDRRDAIRSAFDLAGAGDCVLLAGKGHETSIIWGHEHVPWDEAAVAGELLRDRIGSSWSVP